MTQPKTYAAVSFYHECQNEPSPIEAKLVPLSDSEEENIALFVQMFLDNCGDELLKPEDLTVRTGLDCYFGKTDKLYEGYEIGYDGEYLFARILHLPPHPPLRQKREEGDCRPLYTTENANMDKIVEAWNQLYRQLGKEAKLKDLDPASYERLVVMVLLGLCDDDPKLALAVFRHPHNQGGWLQGSVDSALEKLAQQSVD